MLRSLFTGVTGLRSHSQWLDVIGNNVANVDTVGYKSAGVTFQDLLSQTIQGEVRPASGQGGVSVKQVGLGVTVGSIRNFFNQGALQQTGNPTDLAVQGDGFFTLSSGADTLYTRAGAFTLDANGTLVDSVTGYTVQGASGDVTIAPGSTVAATATTTEYFKGNLDASVADGETYTLTLPVYDSLGTSRTITLTFTKNFAASAGQWDWAATESSADISSLGGAAGSLVFDTAGAISSGDTAALTVNYAASAGAATPQVVTLDFGSASNTTPMTGYAGESTGTLASQDGVASGSLESFTIGTDGSVTGFYSNGTNQVLDTLRLAGFANPGGLLKVGANLYKETGNSGTPSLGNPGTGGRGTIASGNLEMSNVDLAQEFTNLIIAQRGFQANTRVITASDEVLQDLVNIIR